MTRRLLWMCFAAWSLGCGQVVEEEPARAPSNRYERQQALAPPRLYQWECFPETYGFTPSPDGVRFPAEHESDGGLLLAWPGPGCGYPEQTALALAAAGHVPVHVLAAWCYTEAETDAVIGRAHGCDVVTLESMQGRVIDHIDMWMTLLSPKTVLVGRYDVRDDAVNAAILDRNARRLSDLGYDVVRIPMPTPYCQDTNGTCVGAPERIAECDGTNTRVWATFLNSIRLGDVMAVPVYRWVPPSQAWRHHGQEQEALATYQWALDREFGAGAVKVVPIPSDTLIPCQGSLHCITKTFH